MNSKLGEKPDTADAGLSDERLRLIAFRLHENERAARASNTCWHNNSHPYSLDDDVRYLLAELVRLRGDLMVTRQERDALQARVAELDPVVYAAERWRQLPRDAGAAALRKAVDLFLFEQGQS